MSDNKRLVPDMKDGWTTLENLQNIKKSLDKLGAKMEPKWTSSETQVRCVCRACGISYDLPKRIAGITPIFCDKCTGTMARLIRINQELWNKL